MVGVNYKKSLTILLVGLMVLLLVPWMPVMADDESSTDAQVEVLPESGSYGASVIESENTLFPSWALGNPDGRGAFILWKGWISMELEDSVLNAHTISIWAANSGWGASHMNIYVSADGSTWTQVDKEKVVSADFLRYDFSGSFGDVRYIKVSRSGGRWSFLRLDAVCAKGGDESQQ